MHTPDTQPAERVAFDLEYGQVTLTTRQPVTFDSIADFARAGQLLGVAPGAVLTGIRLECRQWDGGPRYEVTVNWQGQRP